eukprot:CAMPEP_0178850994 /NCGR_PEP_ID=MMETSP0746-20121128/20860_1 /TAXON_ID=913974 /ORGANISM="Nitzschia punctata, Strain CCMP561" /LENGTH=78 /DNA_ID=CAMNT_0020516479 /DNA_START=484 /DNA_END=720 /DNA_ORIENTATION=-
MTLLGFPTSSLASSTADPALRFPGLAGFGDPGGVIRTSGLGTGSYTSCNGLGTLPPADGVAGVPVSDGNSGCGGGFAG